MTTEDLMKLMGDFPEINPSNYGDDDVNALNAWGIAAHTALEALGREVEQWKVDFNEVLIERDQARAQLDALQVNAGLVDACGRYEAALMAAFPNGAHGEAFTQWNEARKLLAKRAQAAPAVGAPDSCLWTPDTDYETDVHYSACGEAWSFIEGGPKENKVRFCQGCGKPVVIASAQPQQKED